VLLLVLAAVVVLPWLVPAVPSLLAGLVPDPAPRARVTEDPEVLPPTASASPTQPGSTAPQWRSLSGRRLEQAGEPERLAVERLSVDSAVVPISGSSGVLVPPADAQLLGWWREGAVVGAAHGSAVLTGHTVHTGGGAFDHLRLLVPGDAVRVRTARGSIRYLVDSTRIYSVEALARHSRQVFDLDGPGRLVLITCSDWNGRVYLTNTVVFAHPVERTRAARPGTVSGWRAPL
jgi:LPXTG-site transpeptidase (sortase) family protein